MPVWRQQPTTSGYNKIQSPIRRHYSQRRTLQGLGLNKIGRTVSVQFNGPMWGMIQKVRHLIHFPDQELFEEHRLVLPQPKDEAADVRQLVFNGRGVDGTLQTELEHGAGRFEVLQSTE